MNIKKNKILIHGKIYTIETITIFHFIFFAETSFWVSNELHDFIFTVEKIF